MTANQRYRQSGSTLSFKEWLNNEANLPAKETTQTDSFVGNVKVMNVPLKYILIGAAVIIVGVIAYQAYKKKE